jgi:hypothetical protein
VANPFAALTLIVAPAVLTNASSVLIMSTSNRFARAVDRARILAQDIERGSASAAAGDGTVALKMGQLERLQRRALLLLTAMRLVYLSLGSFATATLVSVVGALGTSQGYPFLLVGLEVTAAGAGIIGVGGLVAGSAYLVHDTRLAVANITEEAQHLRARFRAREAPGPPVS